MCMVILCFCIPNKNVLDAVRDVVNLYPDAKGEALINAIYSNLLGRNKELFIIDGNEVF